MEDLTLLIGLFPLVFMLHDFEEIIVQGRWIEQNQETLKLRFPFLKKTLSRLQGLNTTAFTIAVAEEFILISIVTVCAVVYQTYFLWIALFMAFTLHLAVHLVQFLILRKYHPALITTLIALPYSLYTVYRLAGAGYAPGNLFLCTVTGIGLMVLNLGMIHRFAPQIDRAITRRLAGKVRPGE